jgi:hypothetical protein
MQSRFAIGGWRCDARRACRMSARGLILLILALAAGCSSAARPPLGSWEGPATLATVDVEGWPAAPRPAHVVTTAHYRIFSTIDDPDFLAKTAELMEGALNQYEKMAPGVAVSDRPMDCYLFATHAQWAAFTRQLTGPSASIYLQINRGGYTIQDRYVAYFVGESSTWSVASHEGWHQFCGRNLKGRLPPFLEEGLATMFESVQWRDGLPRWNVSINAMRVSALREAIESHDMWTLEKLVSLHAGNVVTGRGELINAFYSQDWAFAKFLWEGDGGKHRPALQRLMADTASGQVHDPTGTLASKGIPWDPSGVKPMLEYYLGMKFADIDADYQAYIRKVAFDEIAQQYEL